VRAEHVGWSAPRDQRQAIDPTRSARKHHSDDAAYRHPIGIIWRYKRITGDLGMGRILLVDETHPATSDAAKSALERAGLARGNVLNVHRALANRPEVLDAFTGFIQTVYRGKSTLDRKHGELAYITATAVNNCFY
jgi:hypothetical protein